jgi:hypothetical protein
MLKRKINNNFWRLKIDRAHFKYGFLHITEDFESSGDNRTQCGNN